MNEHAPSRIQARGLDWPPARRFSADEFERMAEAGILTRDERVELIAGEIVVMSPKGRAHEVLRSELAFRWSRFAPPHIKVASESPLRLADSSEPIPDLFVFPSHLVAPDVRYDTALLVVEIADSSDSYDRVSKAQLYAASGIVEYWVVNARTLVTTIHRDPAGDGYGESFDVPGDRPVTPRLAPELSVRMAEVARD